MLITVQFQFVFKIIRDTFSMILMEAAKTQMSES